MEVLIKHSWHWPIIEFHFSFGFYLSLAVHSFYIYIYIYSDTAGRIREYIWFLFGLAYDHWVHNITNSKVGLICASKYYHKVLRPHKNYTNFCSLLTSSFNWYYLEASRYSLPNWTLFFMFSKKKLWNDLTSMWITKLGRIAHHKSLWKSPICV